MTPEEIHEWNELYIMRNRLDEEQEERFEELDDKRRKEGLSPDDMSDAEAEEG